MPLRKRVSLAAAGAVALVVAIALLACYDVVRNQLDGQIDSELRSQAARVWQLSPGALPRGNPANEGGSAQYVQYVNASGGHVIPPGGGDLVLPITAAVKNVARAGTHPVLFNGAAGGAALRIYVFHAVYSDSATGQWMPIAVELARPLGPVETILSHLRLILAIVFVLGVALAALLGRMAARRVLAPLAEVTSTAQLIGETDDLGQRLRVHADDEVGQLATRFNEMLERLEGSREALDESVRQQRQLVADASHELRTPVTSLRTNVEVLLAGGQLDEDERRRLLADVVEQSEELSTLVGDLIEVARGDLQEESADDIRLDRIVEDALARARRNAPEVEFREALEPVVVHGSAGRLSRAINNLLDNAARHAGGGPVEVSVDAGGVRVRDHGRGIDEQDLPHIFDRFYRGAGSRAVQGSGLGLAIVRQVAETHGGSVTAANAPGGGAVFTLRLPTSPLEGRDPDGHAGGSGDGEDRYADGGLVTRA